MYLDSAYIAKFYLNEPDAARVREVVDGAETLISSAWAVSEVTCTFHRKLRERWLAESQYRELLDGFREHTDSGFWTFAPMTERLLVKMSAVMRELPASVFLRAGDAIHLTTAVELGESEIWSNDKHLLAAAQYFGLTGRTA